MFGLFSEMTYWITFKTYSGPRIDTEVSVSAKLFHFSFKVFANFDDENREFHTSQALLACCPTLLRVCLALALIMKTSLLCVHGLPL